MKTAKLSCILFGLLFSITTFAFMFGNSNSIPGNGKIISQARNLSNFNAIQVSGSFIVKVKTGAKETNATVIADENLQQYINTQVSNDSLIIRTQQGISIDPSKRVEIDVNASDLKSLSNSGSSLVSIDGINSSAFNVESSGSGQVDISGNTNTMKIDKSGSGKINLSGSAQDLNIDMSGSAEILADKFSAQNVAIDLSGSGRITVRAKDNLKISARGSGKIYYYGQPRISQEVRGSARIESLGN